MCSCRITHQRIAHQLRQSTCFPVLGSTKTAEQGTPEILFPLPLICPVPFSQLFLMQKDLLQPRGMLDLSQGSTEHMTSSFWFPRHFMLYSAPKCESSSFCAGPRRMRSRHSKGVLVMGVVDVVDVPLVQPLAPSITSTPAHSATHPLLYVLLSLPHTGE